MKNFDFDLDKDFDGRSFFCRRCMILREVVFFLRGMFVNESFGCDVRVVDCKYCWNVVGVGNDVGESFLNERLFECVVGVS